MTPPESPDANAAPARPPHLAERLLSAYAEYEQAA